MKNQKKLELLKKLAERFSNEFALDVAKELEEGNDKEYWETQLEKLAEEGISALSAKGIVPEEEWKPDVKATVTDDSIYIELLNDRYNLICKSIEGHKWNSQQNAWEFPKNSIIAHEIRDRFLQEPSFTSFQFDSDDAFYDLLQ